MKVQPLVLGDVVSDPGQQNQIVEALSHSLLQIRREDPEHKPREPNSEPGLLDYGIITITLVNIRLFNTIMSGPCDQNFMRDSFKDTDVYQIYIFCSAVKRLIASKIKKIAYVMCVCCVYLLCVYINTQTYLHIFKKNVLRLYNKYILVLSND